MKVGAARDEQSHRRDLPSLRSRLLALAARGIRSQGHGRSAPSCSINAMSCSTIARSPPSSFPAAIPETIRPSWSCRFSKTWPPHAAGASRGADLAVAAVVQRRRRSTSSTGTSNAKRRNGLPAWLPDPPARPPPRPAQRLPERYKLRLYPDLTHNKLCQYEVPQWDQAYALTLGREAVNPRPAEFAGIHNRNAPYSDGFISYSDGVHDDVNKTVCSALSWDPGLDGSRHPDRLCPRLFPSLDCGRGRGRHPRAGTELARSAGRQRRRGRHSCSHGRNWSGRRRNSTEIGAGRCACCAPTTTPMYAAA